MRQCRPDYYEILELEKYADVSMVRAAYRRLAIKHHPDRGGNAEMFKLVSEAYEVLGAHKAQYDRLLRQREAQMVVRMFVDLSSVWGYADSTTAATTGATGWTVI